MTDKPTTPTQDENKSVTFKIRNVEPLPTSIIMSKEEAIERFGKEFIEEQLNKNNNMENNTPTQVSLNEIKKALYKENPLAHLVMIDKRGINYTCVLKDETSLFFCVPLDDLGDAHFMPTMMAKHLIRYIIH